MSLFYLFIYLLSNPVFSQDIEVNSIKIEGNSVIEEETILSYIPFKSDSNLSEEKQNQIIESLYSTGFFNDILLIIENNILYIRVKERPVIAGITFDGQKSFSEEELNLALSSVKISEGQIFNDITFNSAVKELKNQYLNKGYYSIAIESSIEELDRNRVQINFQIQEGMITKISKINILGVKSQNSKKILKILKLKATNFWSWYTKSDRYSKIILESDIEKIKDFYLQRGYVDVKINSTQVLISEDKNNIEISINLTEGGLFKFGNYLISKQNIVSNESLDKSVKFYKGQFFSRKKLLESVAKMEKFFKDLGYMDAQIIPIPDFDRVNNIVNFEFKISEGRRYTVRRINISGNNNTLDNVIRREMRQFESSWYSEKNVRRSKERIEKLGFFSEVKVDIKPIVDEFDDLVDIDIDVVERQTGSLTLGIGYSSDEHVLLNAGVSQPNFLGTGNALSLNVNSGKVNTLYAVSFTNPSYTNTGISRGFDVYKRDTDVSSLSVTRYKTSTLGGGVRYGVPITEYDDVRFGFAYEDTDISSNASSGRLFDFMQLYGTSTVTYLSTLGWSRDKRDSFIYPTEGVYQKLGGEVSIPVGDISFYRINYRRNWLEPISDDITLNFNGIISYADGYNGDILPYYKYYYAGGVNSVRGFRSSSIGPKDSDGFSLGGNYKWVFSTELLMPLPNSNTKEMRLALFLDQGYVGDELKFDETARASTGLSINWYSVIGPLKLVFAKPLNANNFDKTEMIQFSLGTMF